MKKTLVQIDGSNFYFKLKDLKLHNLLNFDLSKFISFLIKNDSLKSAIYYIGRVKTSEDEKTKILHANQQKLFAHLNLHKVKYSLGYLLKSDGKFHEKGVDVQVAVDMVRGAIKNEYDTCYLISSDSDLLPAIKIARNENKKIVYVGFDKAVSKALMKNCSSSIILKKNNLTSFIKNK